MKKISAAIWDTQTGVTGLLRHKNGNYYSRFQIDGQRTMKALGTDVFSRAKEKHFRAMADNEKARQSGVQLKKGRGKMGDILDQALEAHKSDTALVKKSKDCFSSTIARLVRHWDECFSVDFRSADPAKIKGEQVEKFSNYLHVDAKWRRNNTKKVRKGYGAVTVNLTLEVLHRVLTFAKGRNYITEVPFELNGGLGQKSLRKPEPKKKIDFPTQEKISEVFAFMRTVGNTPDDQPELLKYLQDRAEESGDLAEFMAYSGARVEEAACWTWEDERANSLMIRGTKTETSRDREVPKITAMIDLLARMKERRSAQKRELKGAAFTIKQCRVALETACKRAGISRWTHHSLRHLFATRCIESGVDIPTVSKWLGHADGGALAMKTYGHLRQEHSQAQAAKVSFGVVAA